MLLKIFLTCTSEIYGTEKLFYPKVCIKPQAHIIPVPNSIYPVQIITRIPIGNLKAIFLQLVAIRQMIKRYLLRWPPVVKL